MYINPVSNLSSQVSSALSTHLRPSSFPLFIYLSYQVTKHLLIVQKLIRVVNLNYIILYMIIFDRQTSTGSLAQLVKAPC